MPDAPFYYATTKDQNAAATKIKFNQTTTTYQISFARQQRKKVRNLQNYLIKFENSSKENFHFFVGNFHNLFFKLVYSFIHKLIFFIIFRKKKKKKNCKKKVKKMSC